MNTTKYISLSRLAKELGLPQPWLKAEAEDGRIPSLRIRNRLRFDRDAVERVLSQRTQRTASEDGGAA